MGNQNYRDRIFDAIEKNRHDLIKEIVALQPQVLDEDLSKNVNVTPLARAAYRVDLEIVDLLVKLGANVNNGGSAGVTPLMWAAKRDSAYLVSNFIGYHADIHLVSKEGFTALDYAILHGNYRPALFIFDFCQEIKDATQYEMFAKEHDYRYVNYEMFLDNLKTKTNYQQIPNIFQRPVKKLLFDPVIDPREPWKKMISRVIEFEDPPMVERTDLPIDLQPQNRFWGQMRSYANGMDPTPPVRSNQVGHLEEMQGLQRTQTLPVHTSKIGQSINQSMVIQEKDDLREDHIQIQ